MLKGSISVDDDDQKEQTITACYSGGCEGTDFEWTKTFGKKCIVYSFVGHNQRILPNVGEEIVTLTKEKLQFADKKLDEANKYLKRRNTKFNLLRRNYYIIAKAESCYAIIHDFEKKTASNRNSVRIRGGTAWGCQMFLLKYIKENAIKDRKNVQPPLYAFAQSLTQNKWYGVSVDVEQSKITNIDWITTKPKSLSGEFAGIGVRDIGENGKQAIRKLAAEANIVSLRIPHPINTSNPYPVVELTQTTCSHTE